MAISKQIYHIGASFFSPLFSYYITLPSANIADVRHINKN